MLAKTEEGRRTFTCPNDSCKKTFDAPLKAVNLRDAPVEPYTACPFCLTKIEECEAEPKKVDKQIGEEQTVTNEKSTAKTGSCHYHLGYLSEREQKDKIPDDCIVCKDIVECMLRKMRS